MAIGTDTVEFFGKWTHQLYICLFFRETPTNREKYCLQGDVLMISVLVSEQTKSRIKCDLSIEIGEAFAVIMKILRN